MCTVQCVTLFCDNIVQYFAKCHHTQILKNHSQISHHPTFSLLNATPEAQAGQHTCTPERGSSCSNSRLRLKRNPASKCAGTAALTCDALVWRTAVTRSDRQSWGSWGATRSTSWRLIVSTLSCAAFCDANVVNAVDDHGDSVLTSGGAAADGSATCGDVMAGASEGRLTSDPAACQTGILQLLAVGMSVYATDDGHVQVLHLPLQDIFPVRVNLERTNVVRGAGGRSLRWAGDCGRRQTVALFSWLLTVACFH